MAAAMTASGCRLPSDPNYAGFAQRFCRCSSSQERDRVSSESILVSASRKIQLFQLQHSPPESLRLTIDMDGCCDDCIRLQAAQRSELRGFRSEVLPM